MLLYVSYLTGTSAKVLLFFALKFLTESQAAKACDVLAVKEADFHQVANTGQQPVADDNNHKC